MTTFERVVELLREDSFFDNYNYRKSDSSFIQKFDGGIRKIELEHWFQIICIGIRPGISIRFDFVHKWFEKFSFKTIKDQRSTYTACVWPELYGLQDTYSFYLDETNFKEFENFKHTIKTCAEKCFSLYRTPEDVYIHDVLPYIHGTDNRFRGGIDWFFEYLTICKVVAPENYDNLKSKLLKEADFRMFGRERPEPNMACYYDRLDEILDYLESLSVDDLMKKRIK